MREKIFATLDADESTGHVKCDPTGLDLLVRAQPSAFRDAWGGRWLGIDLTEVNEAEVIELLEGAWRSLAPKMLAASYDRTPDGGAQS
ncbi:MAG: hypothetical protein GWN71_28640 [Gammaproteobacteria bacterium]|nr:MmcQ/YjbR family DNA-binding protein [Gemmatimonadota bacterium]NIU77375.1 hypothetical protein [Gammaproteobacteria bacterium]NIY10958.1 hypothetical protein [Gemmatimonadota bacterium]